MYGWNWDLFRINLPDGRRVAIVTGYRNLFGKRLEGVCEADRKAQQIAEEHRWDMEAQEPIEKILINLIEVNA